MKLKFEVMNVVDDDVKNIWRIEKKSTSSK